MLTWKGSNAFLRQFIYDNIKTYHVIGEGSIMGQSVQFFELGLDLRKIGEQACYCVMDTPYEECIRRVLIRREQKHAEKCAKAVLENKPLPELKEFDPEKTMKQKYDFIQKDINGRYKDANLTIKFINSNKGIEDYIFNLLVRDERK